MLFDPFSVTTCTCKSRCLVGFALQCIALMLLIHWYITQMWHWWFFSLHVPSVMLIAGTRSSCWTKQQRSSTFGKTVRQRRQLRKLEQLSQTACSKGATRKDHLFVTVFPLLLLMCCCIWRHYAWVAVKAWAWCSEFSLCCTCSNLLIAVCFTNSIRQSSACSIARLCTVSFMQ